jgi:hypothetical protein
LLNELKAVIPSDQISSEPKLTGSYTADETSVTELGEKPAWVVYPRDTKDVQRIVSFSSKHKIPIVPCSSRIHFYGRTIPSVGGAMIVNLSRMNKIIELDPRNKVAMIEPGVTFGQLENARDSGVLPLFPLCPPEQKAVLTSYLEREPLLIPKLEYYEPILSMEVVLPTGEVLGTGSASVGESKFADYVVPFGPGLNWNLIFQGAQGTLGIVTRATVKVEPLPKVNKLHVFGSNDLGPILEATYGAQRLMLGNECLILNQTDLSSILSNDGKRGGVSRQRSQTWKSPQWVMIISLQGAVLPEDKVRQEEQALREVIGKHKLGSSSPLLRPLTSVLPSKLGFSSKGEYWKSSRKGGFQDIFFLTTMDKVEKFNSIINETMSANLGQSLENGIGCYIQPVAGGRACHLEYTIFYDSSNTDETKAVKNTSERLASEFASKGAFFSRPYGKHISRMVYDGNPMYAEALRRVKKILDPNGIMNPGKLCF